MLKILMIFACGVLAAYALMHQKQTCNEAVCGSIVTKCLLTESCKCDIKYSVCFKNCVQCLSHLYNDCCSCVDVCSKTLNATAAKNSKVTASKKSKFKAFIEPLPGLFKVLTQYFNDEMGWKSITFPTGLDITRYQPKRKNRRHRAKQEVAPINIKLNCTVTYLSKCTSWMKCQASCEVMGASSCRWFYDGCCECVGENCINYGINESTCRECSFHATEPKAFWNNEFLD